MALLVSTITPTQEEKNTCQRGLFVCKRTLTCMAPVFQSDRGQIHLLFSRLNTLEDAYPIYGIVSDCLRSKCSADYADGSKLSFPFQNIAEEKNNNQSGKRIV
jgi:hypothetical protein